MWGPRAGAGAKERLFTRAARIFCGSFGIVSLLVVYIVRREVSLNERGHIAKQFATEMREGCEREWTMEDIDAEIAAARKDRKVRKSQSTTPSQN